MGNKGSGFNVKYASDPYWGLKIVDNIIKGRLAKERKSWEKQLVDQQTEAEKLASMSEKEKKQYQEQKRAKDLETREAAITRRELTAQAKEQLADKGLPITLAEILNFTDAESCNKSIETVEKAFQSAVSRCSFIYDNNIFYERFI